MKPKKNYIILSLILMTTVMFLVYALKWNAVYKEEMSRGNIITKYIHEVKMEEFNNYIVDNPDSVVYFGKNNDEKSRKFENAFKKVIVDYHLEDRIVFVNVSELGEEDFDVKMDQLYGTEELRKKDQYLREIPALTIYQNAVLVNFKSGESLNKNNAVELLKQYDVIEEIAFIND